MSRTPLEVLQFCGINTNAPSHEDYALAWAALRDLAKSLTDLEMTMRKTLAAATFAQPVEGSNTFLLPSGRKLVMQHKISRSVDESQIARARSEYELANHRPVNFEELLKVKYELVTSSFRKLEPAAGMEPSAAYKAVAIMVTSKPSAPSLELK